MDWSFLIEKQFLKGSLQHDWGKQAARSSYPDPSLRRWIKWIERGRVSDGTTPPQRHSIYYGAGPLMKCRQWVLLLYLFIFLALSLSGEVQGWLQASTLQMDRGRQLNFTLPWLWLMPVCDGCRGGKPPQGGAGNPHASPLPSSHFVHWKYVLCW